MLKKWISLTESEAASDSHTDQLGRTISWFLKESWKRKNPHRSTADTHKIIHEWTSNQSSLTGSPGRSSTWGLGSPASYWPHATSWNTHCDKFSIRMILDMCSCLRQYLSTSKVLKMKRSRLMSFKSVWQWPFHSHSTCRQWIFRAETWGTYRECRSDRFWKAEAPTKDRGLS